MHYNTKKLAAHIARLTHEHPNNLEIDVEQGEQLNAADYHCCIDNFQTSLDFLIVMPPKTEKRKGQFLYLQGTGKIAYLKKYNELYYSLTLHSIGDTMPTIGWRYLNF